jgi:hypothetical protein
MNFFCKYDALKTGSSGHGLIASFSRAVAGRISKACGDTATPSAQQASEASTAETALNAAPVQQRSKNIPVP